MENKLMVKETMKEVFKFKNYFILLMNAIDYFYI